MNSLPGQSTMCSGDIFNYHNRSDMDVVDNIKVPTYSFELHKV